MTKSILRRAAFSCPSCVTRIEKAQAAMHEVGVHRIIMLTGDQPQAAQVIARQVGIAEIEAGFLPEQKLERVRRLRAEGLHVAMIGDGINAAPALAAADT